MEKITQHTGVGVPLRRSNVDTDQIIPAVYLKRVTRTGFERTSSTRPVVCSRALSRWLTADGVRCRARAAPSSVPASTAARSARSWARSRSMKQC